MKNRTDFVTNTYDGEKENFKYDSNYREKTDNEDDDNFEELPTQNNNSIDDNNIINRLKCTDDVAYIDGTKYCNLRYLEKDDNIVFKYLKRENVLTVEKKLCGSDTIRICKLPVDISQILRKYDITKAKFIEEEDENDENNDNFFIALDGDTDKVNAVFQEIANLDQKLSKYSFEIESFSSNQEDIEKLKRDDIIKIHCNKTSDYTYLQYKIYSFWETIGLLDKISGAVLIKHGIQKCRFYKIIDDKYFGILVDCDDETIDLIRKEIMYCKEYGLDVQSKEFNDLNLTNELSNGINAVQEESSDLVDDNLNINSYYIKEDFTSTMNELIGLSHITRITKNMINLVANLFGTINSEFAKIFREELMFYSMGLVVCDGEIDSEELNNFNIFFEEIFHMPLGIEVLEDMINKQLDMRKLEEVPLSLKIAYEIDKKANLSKENYVTTRVYQVFQKVGKAIISADNAIVKKERVLYNTYLANCKDYIFTVESDAIIDDVDDTNDENDTNESKEYRNKSIYDIYFEMVENGYDEDEHEKVLNIIKDRIQKGANVDEVFDDSTMLYYAINQKDNRFAQMLLDLGANPNFIGPDNSSPACAAIVKENAYGLKLLVDYGLNGDDIKFKETSAPIRPINCAVSKVFDDENSVVNKVMLWETMRATKNYNYRIGNNTIKDYFEQDRRLEGFASYMSNQTINLVEMMNSQYNSLDEINESLREEGYDFDVRDFVYGFRKYKFDDFKVIIKKFVIPPWMALDVVSKRLDSELASDNDYLIRFAEVLDDAIKKKEIIDKAVNNALRSALQETILKQMCAGSGMNVNVTNLGEGISGISFDLENLK